MQPWQGQVSRFGTRLRARTTDGAELVAGEPSAGLDESRIFWRMKPQANRRRSAAALLALLISAGTLQLALPAQAAAADGVTETAATTYTVNPAAGRLDVQVDLTVKNTKANTTTYDPCVKLVYDPIYGYHTVSGTCPHTTTYYVNEAYLWLESAATSIKVTANAGTPRITLFKKGDGYNEYRINYKALYKGQTRSLHVTYQIPGGAPRSNADTRIGAAYVSFCVTSNGYDGGSTRVLLPSAYVVTVDAQNGTFSKSSTPDSVTYSTGSMAEPEEFWACFDGDNLGGFKKSALSSPSGRSIEIQAWPEDADWHGEVTRQIEDSLGKLETLIGRPLPGSGTVVVREVSDAGLGAYVGTFDSETSVARVSEDYTQPGVVAHELSHAWFNDSLFNGRWLSEGSAGWAESTITHLACTEPGVFPGAGQPAIATWTFAGPKATAEELDVVDYEYAASCYVVSSVAAKIGEARMRDALASLMDRTAAYRSGDIVLSGGSGSQDWHKWLDAVDELGMIPAGIEDLDFAQNLLVKYGAAPDGSLAARSAARVTYHELAKSVGDWVVPEAILRPMGDWRFDDANAAMDLEAAAFAAVQAVIAELPEVNAATGPVRDLVAAAKVTADLQAAVDQANEQKAAADLIAEARQQVDAQHDILAQIGLLGTDLQPILVSGIAAVTTADLGAAQVQASRIDRTLADSPTQGVIRVGAAVGLLLLLVLGFVLLRRRRLRRRVVLASAITGAAVPGDLAVVVAGVGAAASEITVAVAPDLAVAPDAAPDRPTGDTTGDPTDQSS